MNEKEPDNPSKGNSKVTTKCYNICRMTKDFQRKERLLSTNEHKVLQKSTKSEEISCSLKDKNQN